MNRVSRLARNLRSRSRPSGLTSTGLPRVPRRWWMSTLSAIPTRSLANIPAGDYYVQGLINIYETFHLATGTP